MTWLSARSVWALGFATAVGIGWACSDTAQDCPVGSAGCDCTQGDGCDDDYVCINGTCVDLTPSGDDGNDHGTDASVSMTNAQDDTPDDGMDDDPSADGPMPTTDDDDDTGPMIKLDVGANDTDIVPRSGCTAIDLLFVLDGSASMAEERNALAATNAFNQIILALEALNGGGVDYRIGVTDDDDHGFLTPAGWFQPNPWFDSSEMTAMEIAQAFNGAVSQVGLLGGASTGCEHVLSSGTTLLQNDASGFVREDALLVLVLITDVDDYGAYDQINGNSCGVGCSTPAPPLANLMNALLSIKGDQMDALGAIVVAGDPSSNAGVNFCNQPGSCGCVEVLPGFPDCDVFHATRLYQFAGMLGDNAVAANLCSGPASVPMAVQTALDDNIDIACMMFDPAG